MSATTFWDIPVGGQFLLVGDNSTKVAKPYVRVSELEFKRPDGVRRWMMFRPDHVCVFPQAVVPVDGGQS